MRKFFKIILLIINFVALLLMLGSTMAGYVPPSKFIGFSLLSYGYLYLALANVVFILVWLLLKSKWFILSLLGILVRVSFVPLFFQVGGSGDVTVSDNADNEMITVMTFNSHHFRGIDFRTGKSDTNMLNFIEIVEETNPDVIAMQEYVGRGDVVHLTDSLIRMGYRHTATGLVSGSITGVVVFSKMPVVDVATVGDPSKLYADILWGKDTLRLYCLHLTSYRLDESDQKNIHDLSVGNVDSSSVRSTLAKFRETIKAHEQEWDDIYDYFDSRNKLTVLAADLNDTPASFFYQKCRKYFSDSYREAGQGFSTTYHGLFSSNRYTTFPAFRIDVVLHSPDMEAVAYRRIKSEISDHYPVIATLKKR